MKFELYNSYNEYAGIVGIGEICTRQKLLDLVNNKRKMIFVLRGYNNKNFQFIQYVSYKLENVINRMFEEENEDFKHNVINHYIITLEEGY